jgi:hypothetical protein
VAVFLFLFTQATVIHHIGESHDAKQLLLAVAPFGVLYQYTLCNVLVSCQEWQAAMKCYTKVLDREPGLTNAALERKKLQSKMASLWGFSAFVGGALATICDQVHSNYYFISFCSSITVALVVAAIGCVSRPPFR